VIYFLRRRRGTWDVKKSYAFNRNCSFFLSLRVFGVVVHLFEALPQRSSTGGQSCSVREKRRRAIGNFFAMTMCNSLL
jgi:hypothetical protein